jgi:hypothetical protein
MSVAMQPAQGFVPVDGTKGRHAIRAGVQQRQHLVGQTDLRAVKRHQINPDRRWLGVSPRKVLPDHTLFGDELGQSITSPASTCKTLMASAISSCSGKKQCPLLVACDKVNCNPALTRRGLSCGMPTARAMVSAV